MVLEQIRQIPTERDNIHESCFRSYHVLELVKVYLRDHPTICSTAFISDIIKCAENKEGE